MRKSKFKSLYLLFILVLSTFFIGSLNGQISKGDYSFGFSSTVSVAKRADNFVSVGVSASLLKLITKDIMVGGGIGYSRNFSSTFSSAGREYFPANYFEISPTVRYYFNTGRVSTFTSFENYFFSRNYEKESAFFTDEKGYRGILGFGLNYFLAPNIAFEGVLTSNAISSGDFKGETRYVTLNTGVKYFFSNGIFEEVEVSANSIFKRGNLSTNLNLFGASIRFDEGPTGRVALRPNLNYFIMDNFNIFGDINFSKIRFSTNDQHIFSFNFGSEYYLRLKESLYLSFRSSLLYRLSSTSNDSLFDFSDRWIEVPISTALHYFHKRKRIYLSGTYEYKNYRSRFSGAVRIDNCYKISLGSDYYLSSNLFLNAEFRIFEFLDYFSELKSRSGRFSVGFGMLLFSPQRNKERKISKKE